MLSFKSFFTEISDEHLEKLGDRNDNNPFEHIFGNKTRLLVPLYDDQEVKFVNTLQDLNYNVDLTKGTVTYPVKTNQGLKNRTERIGRVLKELSKKDQIFSDLLSWWEKNNKNIGRNSGVSVIISRHPIDIVRMSDHREFKSCHSPGNNYFKCALQEARTGGAVAYVVRNVDLEKVDIDDDDEIFKDRHRNVGGIEPLERIRLRRFASGDNNLLIPERRTYGIRHVGFADTVKNWAKNIQKIDPNNPPKLKNYRLHGGSYSDNDLSSLWNDFFDTDENEKVEIADKEEENEGQPMDADEMQRRAEEQVEEHAGKNYHVYVDVNEDDGDPYLSYDANVSFQFPSNKIIKYVKEEDIKWQTPLFKELKNVFDSDFNVENIWVNDDGILIIDLHPHDGGGTLESLEHFLDELDREIDLKYGEVYDQVYEILMEFGYLKPWRDDFVNFKHFQPIEEEAIIESEQAWIGDLMGMPINSVGFVGTDLNINKEIFSGLFPKFVKVNNLHFTWKSIAIHDPKDRYIGHNPLNYSLSYKDEELTHFHVPIKVYMQLIFDFQDLRDLNKHLFNIKYLDNNWDYFIKRAAVIWERYKANLEPQKTRIKLPARQPLAFKQTSFINPET